MVKGRPALISVVLRKGESQQSILRRFLKKCKKENILEEIFKKGNTRRYYKKSINSEVIPCNTDYYKSGNSCIKIPDNAYASGSSFMCNNGYYKNSSTTSCLKVPVNAKKYASDKGWSCNTGYTKTGTSCTNTAELERI